MGRENGIMISSQVLPQVHTVFEKCQKRYPTIQMGFEVYLAKLDEVVRSLADGSSECGSLEADAWISGFSRLHHEDLFLATACAGGDRIAWEYFVDDYEPLIRRLAAQACGNMADGEDLSQEILLSLFGESRDPGAAAGEDAGIGRSDAGREETSRLRGYTGRGTLAGWLRVTVAHAAIDRFRRVKRQVSLDELEQRGSIPEPAADSDSAEERNAGIDARWGPVLSRLLAAELERLPARDRLMLNLYYLKEVPLRLIGAHFGVHEATASRWLESLRKGIRKRVERELRTQHGLQARDLKSVWLWISEKENLPLEKLLAE